MISDGPPKTASLMLEIKTKKYKSRGEQIGHMFTVHPLFMHIFIHIHRYMQKIAPGKQSSNTIYPPFIYTYVHAKVAPGKQSSKDDGLHSGVPEVPPLGYSPSYP
jgi:hypothetical protein